MQMHFNGGENCTVTQNYTLSISLKCNAYGSVFDALWIGNVDDTDKCNPMIPVSHKSACPVFSISTFANFFLSKPYIIGPIAIVIGLLVAFTGRKFFPLTIGVIGIGLGGGITLILCSMINLLTSIQLDNTDQEYTDPIYMHMDCVSHRWSLRWFHLDQDASHWCSHHWSHWWLLYWNRCLQPYILLRKECIRFNILLSDRFNHHGHSLIQVLR